MPNSVYRLTNLCSLSLSYNAFEDLPASFSSLAHLSRLVLVDNRLRHVPDVIYTLTNLRCLMLDGNAINTSGIGTSVSALRHLHTLQLADNVLRSAPVVLSGLTSLTTLSLMGNEVGDGVNDVLVGMTQMRYLNLQWCGLGTFPEVRRLCNLRNLYLGQNNIERIPDEVSCLTVLHTLDMSDNRLASLPPSMRYCRHLQHCHLGGNPLLPPFLNMQVGNWRAGMRMLLFACVSEPMPLKPKKK